MKATRNQAKAYAKVAKQRTEKPPLIRNLLLAFVVGGAICAVSQVILQVFMAQGLTAEVAATPTSAVMIGVGALLTGLGVYDEIGRYGGMGAALPITGFANSIVAPAMEYKREGFVLGVGAKMFTVAGPVIVYGLTVSIVAATIAWLLGVRVQ